MTREEIIKQIETMKVGQEIDVKFGMSTRAVVRAKKTKYEIHDFVDGWQIAYCSLETVKKVINGEISFIDLDWE